MSVRPSIHDMEHGESVQGGADVVEGGPGEENQEDQDRNAGEETQEAMAPRIAPVPISPSTKEVESHMLTHLPYRAWCPHCIREKSKGRA